MEIKIGKDEIVNPEYANCFKIEMDFMIGDADGDTSDTVFVSEDNKNLNDFLKCLEMCSKAFEVGGMGGCDTFSEVPGYGKFFADHYDDEEEEDEDEVYGLSDDEDEDDDYEDDYDEETEFEIQTGSIHAQHPYQPDGSGIECSFEGYTITYFNSEGKEFPVEVIFTTKELEEMRKELKKAGYKVQKSWS